MKKTSLSIVSLLSLLGLAFVPAALIAQQTPGAQSAPGGQQGPNGQRGPNGRGGPNGQREPDPGQAAGHIKGLALDTLRPPSGAKLTVTSPAFKDHGDIPYENTYYKGNIFPGLTWTAGPAGTKSYAVFVQGEAEGGQGGTSIHLTLFNIPASVTSLKEAMTDPPQSSIYGPNIRGTSAAYAAPHTHTTNKNDYHYQVFALDTVLPYDLKVYPEPLIAQMSAHVLASGDLVGVSSKDPNEAADAKLSPWLTPIKIKTGSLTGARGRDPSIIAYKGIPYAAPPVGDLRWKLPQPAIPWQGVRTADHFGPDCPGGSAEPKSEDCLFANVWTKGPATANDPPRPVVVWNVGARFASNVPEVDGENLVKKGVIVVTFQHRGGVFGQFASPELSKESGHNTSGNYTLLDTIFLLQWVHDNIAAFGGDPAKVTVMGESGGAGVVNFLAISPLTKGLIVRAIAESHSRYYRDPELGRLPEAYRTLAEAEARGEKYMQDMGVTSVAQLRAMTPEQLLKVQCCSGDADTVLDGYAIPNGYNDAYQSHTEMMGEFLAGNNRDETGAGFLPGERPAAAPGGGGGNGAGGGQGQGGPGGGGPAGRGGGGPAGRGGGQGGGGNNNTRTVAGFTDNLTKNFAPMSDQFLKLYPVPTDADAAKANNDLVHDNSHTSVFLFGTNWEKVTGKQAYNYYWTYRSPGSPSGASHGSEVPFVFNNLDLDTTRQNWSDEDKKVADIMSSYWTNFIKTGNPNGPGLPYWPATDAKSPKLMELGEHFAPIPVATPEKLALWEKYYQTQKAW